MSRLRNKARWFFHVVEDDRGGWPCRRGGEQLDAHALLTEALEHIFSLASRHRPSEVFVNLSDGRVRRDAVFE